MSDNATYVNLNKIALGSNQKISNDDDDDDDNNDDDNNNNNLFKRVKFSLAQGKPQARVNDEDEEREEFNRSVNKRPVTTIPAVKRMFDADPKKSIKDNVPVHTSNEDLDNYRQEITKITQNKEQQNKVADALWENDDYSFIKMVQGFTRDTTLMNREVTVPVNTPVSLMQSGPFSEKFQAAPVGFATEGQIAAFLEQTESKVFRPNERDAYNKEFIAKIDKMRVLENIDRVTDLPQVSGTVQMSSVMYAALLGSLVSLASMNKSKFAYKERHHFYKDGHVKTMFARLVAAFISEGKVVNPNQYYKDRDEGRRNAMIEFSLKNLDNNSVWDAGKGGFVYASEEQTEEIKQTKRKRWMDVYDMSNIIN